MKQIIVSFYSPQEQHPSSFRVQQLKNELESDNHETFIIATHPGEALIKNEYQLLIPRKNYSKVYFYIRYFFNLFFGKIDAYYFLDDLKSINFTVDSKDTVICTGPPFSTFLIGKYFKERYNSALVLDYRDPFSLGYRPMDNSKILYELKCLFHRSIEQQLIKIADKIQLVHEALMKKKLEVDKVLIKKNKSVFNSNKKRNPPINGFVVVYPGRLYKDQLYVEEFFQFLEEQIPKYPTGNVKLIVFSEHIGAWKKYLTTPERKALVEFYERVPRDVMYEELLHATAGVFFPLERAMEIEPLKLLDYKAIGLPVIVKNKYL